MPLTMPLTKIQRDVLRLLASLRDPESDVAGSTPLNRGAARFSSDIEVFHDREERVAQAAERDAAVLERHGYSLRWLRRDPLIYTVAVASPGHDGESQATAGLDTTKLEWVVDSDFRFLPTVPDEIFGHVLHPAELATNKASAGYGRREPRDVVDLITIHDTILPLGAVIWASVGRTLGFTPEGVINEIRRNARYTEADFRRPASDPPVDPARTMNRLREILTEAESFVAAMPTEVCGSLFLQGGRVVQPDPARLEDFQTHLGRCRGHWPASLEISSAMLKSYGGIRPD